jgi:hypothetical protein
VNITKRDYGNRRPDIIFHKRGINQLNFLVCEIKTNGSSDEDIKKIKRDWMRSPSWYHFGASIVVVLSNNFEATVFEKGRFRSFSISSRIIPLPRISRPTKESFKELVDAITTLVINADFEKPQKQAKVQALEREIGQMVHELYGLSEKEIKIVEES